MIAPMTSSRHPLSRIATLALVRLAPSRRGSSEPQWQSPREPKRS